MKNINSAAVQALEKEGDKKQASVLVPPSFRGRLGGGYSQAANRKNEDIGYTPSPSIKRTGTREALLEMTNQCLMW